MTRYCLLLLLLVTAGSVFAEEGRLYLANDHVRITWQKSSEGWKIWKIQLRQQDKWQTVNTPSGEYTFLYSAVKPDETPKEFFKTSTNVVFPEPVYKYQINLWKESISPVAMNEAGKAFHFFPAGAKSISKNKLRFIHDTDEATIITEWTLDKQYPTDIIVEQKMICRKAGYYSLASPTLANIEEKEMSWVTVPGYFQGNEMQKNFVLSYAYGQGIPEKPVVYRERSASTLCPIISMKKGISLSVIPDTLLGRNPWAYDHNTHKNWIIGLSHKNRKSQLSPTMYYPVLGEVRSKLQAGDSISYSFRYSLMNGDWQNLFEHAVNDVYHFKRSLSLRRNQQSLTGRMGEMRNYLSDRKTSLWNIEEFNGLKIGGQSYLGGVVGSDHDAIKNSDYGAMWMLANIADDPFLKDSVLPYALNFKLTQQQTVPGFFQGAAMGQYYLSKSKKYVEEWGEFVEPVSLTYYIMLDIGNIMLFEPNNIALKERLQLGADLLEKWQKPDGSWELAYDRHTNQPLFTDLKDLRPTFYGLLVAYRILKDSKYLIAAKKGADWFVQNAVAKGHFIGVCGDARYAPDFATAQSAQALLDLYELTGDKKYQLAAIRTARMYLTSIYTQPVASEKTKTINGVERVDWQISQSGLSFEHGGIFGSANSMGPIMLCSHAGLFVRMFQLTRDSLFIDMARAAAIGRDAFVDPKTSVASYYWSAMNKGAGPYPHHAWWQVGWITDYLMAEAQLRSNNRIIFPRGFVTPKVGPHESYGFAAGIIFNEPANLIIRDGLVECNNPNIECITALGENKKKLFVILLNDTGEETTGTIKLTIGKLQTGKIGEIRKVTELTTDETMNMSNAWDVSMTGYGIKVYQVEVE